MARGDAAARRSRRRRLVLGLLRALAGTAVLVALYYLLPLDRLTNIPLWVFLLVGVVALTALAFFQVRGVLHSRYPTLSAVEGLAVSAPLFVVLFAAAYVVMSRTDPESFNVGPLSRTDSLYFTVTVLVTVGFGDITATSQAARLLVTAQMILDLIVVGLGIRLFVEAVRLGRTRQRRAGEHQ